jgi:hypothetical protein
MALISSRKDGLTSLTIREAQIISIMTSPHIIKWCGGGERERRKGGEEGKKRKKPNITVYTPANWTKS